MTDMTARLSLLLNNSQFERGLRDSNSDLAKFTRQGRQHLRGLQSDFAQLTGGIFGRFKGEILSLGTAWASFNILNDSAHLDKSLTRMTQTGGVLVSQAKDLRSELFQVQKDYGVVVEQSQKATDALLQSGLDWGQASQGTIEIAPATAVTGATPETLAGALSVSAEIFDFDLSKAGTATMLLDQMVVAGRAGNAELENLAAIFARVGGNARRAGMDMQSSLGFIEQLSLIERNPERLATLADSTLRIFTNQKYRQNVTESLGVSYYSDDGSRREASDVLGDIASIYQRQKTDQQRDALLGFAFGETDLDTQRGLGALLSGNALQNMAVIVDQIGNAGGTLANDLKDATDNAIDQTARLRGALRESADGFATSLNSGVSSAIQILMDKPEKGGLGLDGDDMLWGAAGAIGAGMLFKGGRRLLGRAGDVGAGVATGKALEHLAGVQPVYVVNMPGDGLGSSLVNSGVDITKRWRLPGGPGAGTFLPNAAIALPGPAAGASSVMAHLAAIAKPLGLLAGAGAAGVGVGTLISKQIEGTDFGHWIGRSVARALALVGDENAQRALDAEKDSEKMLGRFEVAVSDERVKVKRVESRAMDIDVVGGSLGVL